MLQFPPLLSFELPREKIITHLNLCQDYMREFLDIMEHPSEEIVTHANNLLMLMTTHFNKVIQKRELIDHIQELGLTDADFSGYKKSGILRLLDITYPGIMPEEVANIIVDFDKVRAPLAHSVGLFDLETLQNIADKFSDIHKPKHEIRVPPSLT